MTVAINNINAYSNTGYTLLIIGAIILTYVIVLVVLEKLPKDKDEE